MNILVFSWRDPKHPLAGGAEQSMHEHMKGWVKKGHRVTLFSSKVSSLAGEELLDGIQILRRGYQYLGVQVMGFLYYLKNRNRYDLLVDQFHGLPFFTPLFSKKPKLAVIQEPAAEVWFKNPLPIPLNWIIGLVGFLCEPLVFLTYKRVHFMTGSESAKSELSKYGIRLKNVTVVPHGVILPKGIKSIQKSDIPTITFLGMLSKDKGIEDALRCFAIIQKQKKHYRFWVIGKPETVSYGRSLKDLSKRLGLEIKFWGRVNEQRKFSLLERSWVLVNPSVREGWGLVNIEANAFGTPIVAYKSLGLIDSVKDGVSGIFCDKNTPENMAGKVMELVSNRKILDGLSRSSKLWASRFDWRISTKKSLDLVKKVYKGEI